MGQTNNLYIRLIETDTCFQSVEYAFFSLCSKEFFFSYNKKLFFKKIMRERKLGRKLCRFSALHLNEPSWAEHYRSLLVGE
jgi:hypothetical protein